MFIFDIFAQLIIFMMDHILIILPAAILLAVFQYKLENRKHKRYWDGVDAMIRRDGAAFGNAETTRNFLDN